jgi:hypothetical protein
MLRSHRVPCSRVPAPLFVFLRRATPSHFHLHEGPSHGYSISAARSMFPARPRLLAFPLRARCSPHARSVPHAHTRSHFRCALAFPHAHSHFRSHCCGALAVPRTTAHCARPLTASRFLLRLALPPPPCASSSASRFLHLALPPPRASSASCSPPPRLTSTSPRSASPHRQSRARHRTQ